MVTFALAPPPLPFLPSLVSPGLPLAQLTQDEKDTIERLQYGWDDRRAVMEECEAYYLGEQAMTNLGIAIPSELHHLRTVIGWPASVVDPLADRLSVQDFRLRGQLSPDQDLQDLWDENHLDAEQSPLHLDAVSLGSGWYTIGAGDSPGDPAMIRVESPLNMLAEWDPRTLRPRNVLQMYWADESWHAVLYKPTGNVYMDADQQNRWQLVNRQPHNLGRPLVARIVNRPRTRARDGASEITAAIRNITDAACRTLLSMQVAGEIYSVPQRYALGVTESDFQDAAGNMKTAWQTYITRMLALERDEEGQLPQVGQFQAGDPNTFTKVLDWYAAKIAGMVGATPQEFGLYSEGNPPSADAVSFADSRRDRQAKRKQALFRQGHVEAMQLGLMVMNRGKLPADMRRIDVDWEEPGLVSFPAVANGISQLVSTRVLPPTSDITLAKAGFTPLQIQQLKIDRKVHQGNEVLQQIANQFATPNQPQPNPASNDGTADSGSSL